VVFRATAEWETAINLLKGELIIGIGTLKLKKRRDDKGAAHKVRGQERAATKAAKKTAEEVKGAAGAVHNFDRHDMDCKLDAWPAFLDDFALYCVQNKLKIVIEDNMNTHSANWN
jgi:hypothetical protein